MEYLKPFDYGNVLANIERVKNARYARDPNNPRNRYIQAQVNALRNPVAGDPRFGGIDPTSQMKNDQYRSWLIKNGASSEDLARFDNAVARQWHGEIGGVPHYASGGGLARPMAGASLQGEMQGAGSIKNAQVQGGLAGERGLPYTAPVQSSEIDLSMPTTPVTKAENVGLETKAQEEAKNEALRKSPAELKKQSMREADAANAMVLIEDMLAPRKDGKGIYASYAYGKGNVILGDLAKPQEWIDAEAKRNQLVSMMQLENVAKLKGTGPITEPEQKVLRQAMTVLENPLISPELVEREMKRVLVMFKRWEREAKAAQGKSTTDGEGQKFDMDDYNARKQRLLGPIE